MSPPDSNSDDGTITAGEVAFNAHRLAWSNNGLDVGHWADVLPAGKDAWEAAANAVIAAFQTHGVLTGKRGDQPVDVLYPPIAEHRCSDQCDPGSLDSTHMVE